MHTHPLQNEIDLLSKVNTRTVDNNHRITKAVDACMTYVVSRRDSCKFPLAKIPEDINVVIEAMDKHLEQYDRDLIEDLFG